ncbi:hypothetical protein BDV97DRAFT_128766 [Delphinella strobiligena]|nr:hypothetical protein BDV97DRAFT_128766 [Delphinella strobiligena]
MTCKQEAESSKSSRSKSSNGDDSEENNSDTPTAGDRDEKGTPRRKRLREQTKTACLRCKKRKGKCSGERPVCTYCRNRKIDCQYDVRVGISKRAELERKLNEATTRSCELGILLHALQSGSDEESTMLLARLRMGESLDNIVSSLLTPKDETVGAVPAQTHTQNEHSVSRRYVSLVPIKQEWLDSYYNSVVSRQLLPAEPVHAFRNEGSPLMTEESLSSTIVHQEPLGSQRPHDSVCEDAK